MFFFTLAPLRQWGFDSECFHWACYERWPERPRFARAVVDAWIHLSRSSPADLPATDAFLLDLRLILDEPLVAVFWEKRYGKQDSLCVRPVETGLGIGIPVARWDDWLARGVPVRLVTTVACGNDDPKPLRPFEVGPFGRILPVLRLQIPSTSVAMRLVDMSRRRL